MVGNPHHRAKGSWKARKMNNTRGREKRRRRRRKPGDQTKGTWEKKKVK